MFFFINRNRGGPRAAPLEMAAGQILLLLFPFAFARPLSSNAGRPVVPTLGQPAVR